LLRGTPELRLDTRRSPHPRDYILEIPASHNIQPAAAH
jgi:hypothetical protein